MSTTQTDADAKLMTDGATTGEEPAVTPAPSSTLFPRALRMAPHGQPPYQDISIDCWHMVSLFRNAGAFGGWFGAKRAIWSEIAVGEGICGGA